MSKSLPTETTPSKTHFLEQVKKLVSQVLTHRYVFTRGGEL
jgi:hypothetical protein